ncbi:MAG: hypothetical protein CBB97_22605 [Candidatus Endolissoclinum sp. TMED37]|nr:MAG: hypothetical protein CBB97_22605 [Candidatus Endolissoclinum sp. TMED37]
MGRGPPVVFSTGLFGSMPAFLYNDFCRLLKRNYTIVTIDDYGIMNLNDYEEIVDALNVKSTAFVSHSTFDTEILTSDFINSAVLCDPIGLPSVDLSGFKSAEVFSSCPVLGLKAEKTYSSDFSVPEYQYPIIKGDYEEETYSNMGHIDVLDDWWAEFGKSYGFWDSVSADISDFNNWKFRSGEGFSKTRLYRKSYRESMCNRIIGFIKEKNCDSDKNNKNSGDVKSVVEYNPGLVRL